MANRGNVFPDFNHSVIDIIDNRRRLFNANIELAESIMETGPQLLNNEGGVSGIYFLKNMLAFHMEIISKNRLNGDFVNMAARPGFEPG